MAVKAMSFVSLYTSLCFILTVNSQKKYPVSFDDALLHPYSPEVFNGTWISSNEYLFEDDSSLYKTNVETGETTTVLNRTVIDTFNLTDVLVSADCHWVAIEHDKQSIFRHSRTSLYTIIQLTTGNQYMLAEGQRIQLVVWAPVGAGLMFVKDNDVYYQSESDRLKNTSQRITNSSKDIYNGVADWVYEEEVLGDTKALWFSPDGSKVVFATMNDVNVRNVTFWKYGDPNIWINNDFSSQYVQEVVIKYPKVGTRNPVAYLNYVDLSSGNFKPVIIKAPEDIVTSDNILGPVSWANNQNFSVTWMERLQTKAFTQLCNVDNNIICNVVYTYKEENGWLDVVEPVWVNSTTFLTILPHDQGGQLGNYRQLSLVQDGQVLPLTSGPNVVTAIRCYDRQDNTVYYSSTVSGDSATKVIFKMNLNTPEKKECYSCLVQQDCAYSSATFSRNCTNMLLTCQGPTVPQYNIYNKNGTLLQHLSNNSRLSELLTNLDLPTKQDLSVPVGGGFNAKVRLLLPPNVDKSGRTKYPVLFSVYAGPDFNKISNAWATPGWDDYLVTKRRIIVVYLDARGSGLRGDKLKFAVYHKLGGPEIEDIITVGQYLQQKFPFVDSLRTAIWGWSYGGFATAMVLAKDRLNIFRCGISVAPVTNWIFYDTVYTERYMGLPTNDSNLAGYMASDVSAHVDNFRHKLFYLIHGNADDNVHYQQSMMLSRALELADILFFQQSYPDETHGLSHVHRHLYHSMDKFWTRCFHLNSSDYLDPGLAVDLSVDYSDAYSSY